MLARIVGLLIIAACVGGFAILRLGLRRAGGTARVSISGVLTSCGLVSLGIALAGFTGGTRLTVATLGLAMYVVGFAIFLARRRHD